MERNREMITGGAALTCVWYKLIAVQQLDEESMKIGLRMNPSKTKIMTNIEDDRDIKIGDTVIERVDS